LGLCFSWRLPVRVMSFGSAGTANRALICLSDRIVGLLSTHVEVNRGRRVDRWTRTAALHARGGEPPYWQILGPLPGSSCRRGSTVRGMKSCPCQCVQGGEGGNSSPLSERATGQSS